MITRISDKFYFVTSNERERFVECDAKNTNIPSHSIFDLFISGDAESGWEVMEGISGAVIAEGNTRGAAISNAVKFLGDRSHEDLARIIASTVRKTGVSPRYKLNGGLTKEQVTATIVLSLTSETPKTKEKPPVARKSAVSKTEQASEQRAAAASVAVATVPPIVPTQGQLEIVEDSNILSAEDSIRLETNIEKTAGNINRWILQLYRGKAYLNRGYRTWNEYYAAIVGKSKASAYRAVDEAIQKEKLLEMGIPSNFSQKQITALKPVIEQGKDVVEAVIKDAKKIVTAKGANEKVRSEFMLTGAIPASAIQKAVEKVVPPKAEPDHEDVTLSVVRGNPIDLTSGVDLQGVAGDEDEETEEGSTSPGEEANLSAPGNVHLLRFGGCVWHLDPVAGIPTGCLKVETKKGGYVLVPYSAMYEIYKSWPAEFMDEEGNVLEPDIDQS